ncbi:hypothetical protein [Pseudophaeobacter sp.]|uniref:hypothetical protein n=1 Tax=Pseudophaeobacter sp. TaxID=1971739 RepID=UPI003296BA61
MTRTEDELITIDRRDESKPVNEWKKQIIDAGRRRHLSYSMDFDTRSMALEEPQDSWTDKAKELHLTNQQKVIDGLKSEYGEWEIDQKIENFKSIGTKPFSVISYHNQFFDQIRRAFVIGAYYPALVGACALGERILNHLILDLRDHYKHTPEYKKVYKKSSFDSWRIPIDTLESWGVLLPKSVIEFNELMSLRHRSIHFNESTYMTLKDDALAAILHLREIIEQQFTTHGARPWFIKGTKGHVFIKKEFENDPFVQEYFLPTCHFFGPYFSISFAGDFTPQFCDFPNYGEGEWTDEEFAKVYEEREHDQLAKFPDEVEGSHKLS